MAALPAVRALEPQLTDAGIDVLLINIHDDAGAALAERFAFRFSPTYLVFGQDGDEVWRGNGMPTFSEVQRALGRP